MKALLPTLLCSALLAGFLPVPLQAASIADNGRQAQASVQEDGYLIFAYADGWDDYSRARVRELMEHKNIRKAAGSAVMIPFPIPEQANEERRKQQDELRGGLNIPGCMSYPAIIMLDNKGQHYASLEGRVVSRGSIEELAGLISRRIAAGHERQRFIAESEDPGKTGPERAGKLFAAYQLEGLSWAGKGFTERLARLDPEDASGVVRASQFNAYGFAGKLNGMGVTEGMAEVNRMLDDPAYTPRQKQMMCAAVLGMLRRKGSLAEAEDMRRYAKRMQELVPGTPESGAAAKILREWIPGLYYPRGWSPGCIPTENTPVELQGELPISKAGKYTITFQYTHGSMMLIVHGVELFDGKRKIAEDIHRGSTGHSNWQNSYTLTVPKKVREPHIYVILGQANRDSHGKITIERH